MTLDQQIQVWNAVGTWVAGIATFVAVVVSLRLARSEKIVRLRSHAGLRVLIGGDVPGTEEFLQISVTNLAFRTVTVSNIGWVVGRGKAKRHCIQTLSGRLSDQIPTVLAHGSSANYLISFKDAPNWLSEFSNGFIKSKDTKVLGTLRAQVHTSVGQSISVKPEQELKTRLTLAFCEKKPAHGGLV